jgi:hypothetical protein
MYAAIASVLVVIFAATAVLFSFRFRHWQERVLRKLEGVLLWRGLNAVFDSDGLRRRELLLCVRAWVFGAAIVFALLGLQHGSVIQNQPRAISTVFAHGVAGMAASSALVMSILAFAWFLPGVKAYMTLSQCGLRGLWLTGPQGNPRRLVASIADRMREASHVSILDVTGYELLGKGPGEQGGLLFDALTARPDLPVSLLLLKPHAEAVDPERQQATVFQTVLGELRTPVLTYLKKLRLTLQAVQLLNAERPPEARITVRFYNERPTLRAVIFDAASMLVSPWQPREDTETLTILDIKQDSAAPSLFESFRRSFARLWSQSVDSVVLAQGSSRRIAKRPAAEAGSAAEEPRFVAVNLAARAAPVEA